MAINLTAKYSAQIDKAFTHASFLDGHFTNKLDFTSANTVKVYSVNTITPVDYYKRTNGAEQSTGVTSSNRYGTPSDIQDTVQTFVMTQDKAFSGVVDKGDSLSQSINKAGEWLKMEIDEQIVPMMDAYKMAQIIAATATTAAPGKGTKIVETIGTASGNTNPIDAVLAARANFVENLVPEAGRVWFVSSAMLNALMKTDYFVNIGALGEKAITKGQMGELFGSPVIEVPASILGATTNFVLTYKDAVATPSKIAETKVHIDPPGYSGHLMEGRYFYDCFVFAQKAKGIYVSATA